MAYKIVNDDSLTSVANAIRVQGSISGTLEFPDGFVSAIQNLSPSPTLQTKSVTYTPSDSAITDTVTADSGYDGLDEVDVTVNAVPEADFGASVGLQFYTEDGVEKCEVSGGGYAENAGWIDEGAVLTREVHPAIASGTTITPTTSTQTIGGYKNVMEGAVTINPIPSNYKDTTDATATADKILQGYTAYANGQKLTGTASGGITPSGTMSITSNGTYDVTQYAIADVNVSGGGGSANIGTATTTTATEVSSTISTVTFTGIQGEPQYFFLRCTYEFSRSASDSSYYILAMSYDGTGYQSTTYYRSSGQTYNNNSSRYYSFTYSDGTLVIQSRAGKAYKNGGFYPSVGYSLVYVY